MAKTTILVVRLYCFLYQSLPGVIHYYITINDVHWLLS